MSRLSMQELQILLIEPSATQRHIIRRELEQLQVTAIDCAANQSEALAALQRTRPDLVISSLYFDDGSADQLLQQLRADPAYQDLPFMLISSETRRAQLEVFKQSGVIAILPKPFTHNHLAAALNATLDLLSQEEIDLELYDIDNLRVLVVDDSRLARRHIMRVLQNLGINHLIEAEDGKAAIAHLNEEAVDLVVTDYNMPEVNGAELVDFIRHSALHSHLPVLMVTSEANNTQLSQISQSGVDALADKPFEPATVRKLLARLLDRH